MSFTGHSYYPSLEKCTNCNSMNCQRSLANGNNCCNERFYRGYAGNQPEPPPPFTSASAPPAPGSCDFMRRCMNRTNANQANRCGKVCTNFGHLLTLMASLFTMVILVMVYFMPPNATKISNQIPNTNIWFQDPGQSWMPYHLQTWSSQGPLDSNQSTTIEELQSWSSDRKTFRRFRLTNSFGMSVELCSLGASVTALHVPDKQGDFADVVLGFDNARDYLADSNPYFGATVGRVANRIASGQFSIDNVTYLLAQNDGNNHLHGGIIGFDAVNWHSTVDQDSGSVTFSYHSSDGEEGYPGDMNVFARYSLSPVGGALQIEYSATATLKTPINLANHMYFNLAGHQTGKKELLEHSIQLNAEFYTPVDGELIPTGEIQSVTDTPFDLRVPKLMKDIVGKVIKFPIEMRSGYDHNFVIWPTNLASTVGQNRFVGRAVHAKSGRTLEVYSNQPGVQFYTGNFLPTWQDESLIGKDEVMYEQHGGFCLETQVFPDAINQGNKFGLKSVLNPGEIYYHNVMYVFDTMK